MKACVRIQTSRVGFTLIELTAVIGIIAILTALLLGAASVAKARANSVVCRNNLGQLGDALVGFASQYGCYPLANNPGFLDGRHPEHQSAWSDALSTQEGVKLSGGMNGWAKHQGGIWDCPNSRQPTGWPGGRIYVDYGYNTSGLGNPVSGPDLGLGGTLVSATERIVVKDSAVAMPSAMYALGDTFYGDGTILQDGRGFGRGRINLADPTAATMYDRNRALRRHGGNGNVAFCDGHVEPVHLQRLLGASDDDSLRSWNRDNQPHPELLTK